MAGIKIPVDAQFDAADIEKVVQQFTQQINRLGAAIAQANKIKFNPIDRQSIEDIRRITAGFESLRRVSGDLNRRLSATGQSGIGFTDVDWAKLYADPASRARQMRKAFEYVVGPRFVQPAAPSPSGGQSGGGSGGGFGGGSGGGGGGGGGSGLGATGRQIIGAGLGAMGPVGGVANSALSAGLAGGIGAGLLGFAGGLAAFALGKAIGAVREKISAAQQENIGYDTLKRQLGDVNVSFGVLKASLRSASSALDTTFEEGQRLGTQFAKLSGMTAEQYKTLAEEVKVGGGFGRAFGLDPAQSNAFFAQMRQFQVTSNDADSRRLALLIGESISKSNAFSKADEVLEAISNYTAQQTRIGMGTANVAGYAGMLSGLIGSRMPGLDPTGAAALLGRVNASIAGGGAAGEAGQNFIYSALGARLGLTPIQTALLREQGIFGTGRGTFGAGSMYELFASKHGLSIPAAAGSDMTNLQMLMQHFRRNYAGRPELMIDAMANLFGTNLSQSIALASISPEQIGGLAGRLNRLGIRIQDISHTGISRISQIEADRNLSDADKDRMIKEAASQNQEETEGSRTRATISGVERAVQSAADKMVPIMNDMRAGIMYLAGDKGSKSPREIQEAIMRAESRDRVGNINSEFEKRLKDAAQARIAARRAIQDLLGRNREALLSGTMTQEEHARQVAPLLEREQAAIRADTEAREWHKAQLEKEAAALEENIRKLHEVPAPAGAPTAGAGAAGQSLSAATAAAPGPAGNLRGDAWLMAELARTDRELGLPPGTSAAQIAKESSFNPNAVSRKGAMGLAQVMPATLDSLQRRLGRKLNPYDPKDAVIIHRELMKENMQQFGNVEDALSAYNGGWDRGRWGNAETSAYAPWILRNRGMYATGLPEGAGTDATNHRVTGSADVNVTLQLPNGQPAAPTQQVKVRLASPTPAGL